MDYIDAFKNLKTNRKYSRKSPHKAILLLTIIEMFESNDLLENKIPYNDLLKNNFKNVWRKTLRNEPLFHSEAYLPYWYMQSESFWHVVPKIGKEDIINLFRENNTKPSEATLRDCVQYAELDEDLYFLMTLQSGRSSLKKVLLESYTDLSESLIAKYAESVDNSVDYFEAALSEYQKVLSQDVNGKKSENVDTDDTLRKQFFNLTEDIQIMLNFQYYSFLKSHRKERDVFKEIYPSVYDLYDKIVNHPIKRNMISPSLIYIFDNFLSDLKISMMSEDGSMDLIDKIENSIDILRGKAVKIDSTENDISDTKSTKVDVVEEELFDRMESNNDNSGSDSVDLDNKNNIAFSYYSSEQDLKQDNSLDNKRGSRWTENEEKSLSYFFNQGKDYETLARLFGRTEVAIKARLGKLGLIDYTYVREDETSPRVKNYSSDITNSSLYKNRKYAIIRALEFLRLPASVGNITRAISKTLWVGNVSEEDVEKIIKTMPEVDCINDKYALRR